MLFATKPKTILLDYQMTLVANGHLRNAWYNTGDYREWIAQEVYRTWLVDLLKGSGATVLLVTARPGKYRRETLARIADQLGGWQPDEAFFNDEGLRPPACKLKALEDRIYQKYGSAADGLYLALESNAETRRMYAKQNIKAVDVRQGGELWKELPTV